MEEFFVQLIYADGRTVTTLEGEKKETLDDFIAWTNDLETGETIQWGSKISGNCCVMRSHKFDGKN